MKRQRPSNFDDTDMDEEEPIPIIPIIPINETPSTLTMVAVTGDTVKEASVTTQMQMQNWQELRSRAVAISMWKAEFFPPNSPLLAQKESFNKTFVQPLFEELKQVYYSSDCLPIIKEEIEHVVLKLLGE